jgi:acyl transferase domain-containing protein/NADPH:quinone reductase-like Zn-dependent oxidoreductase/acyl carrier protein/SAM-dependent methyltransferase
MKHASTPRSGREIAIIGMSGRFPGGANSPAELWELLQAGRDGVTEAKGDRWDLGWHHPDADRDERVYTRAGGFLDRVDSFDAEFFGISPKEARQVDPQHRLLLELAWEAMEDANLAPRGQAGSDTGVFIGISGNDYANLVGPQGPDAYSNTGSSLSIAANRISYIFDLHGPSVALDTACSSSLVCVHQACMSLLSGECSSALAGGVNLLLHVRPWIGFARASMLSPTGRCRSFDASGDGYVRAEGGGLVLLKPLEDAERDGDRILGVIRASGVNSDGRTLGLSMPNGDAQERLLRKVYAQSGLSADDIFYVEAHGTGTSVGDPIECGALGRVLGSPRTDGTECYIGSVKSNIGHLEAASGIAGLTKVLLALRHRVIPGNLHFQIPNPKIDFKAWKLNVITEPMPLPVTDRPIVIGVNSFGFGGTNAHLVIEEYRAGYAVPVVSAHTTVTQDHVLVLSGHSQTALAAVAESYIGLLRSSTPPRWEEICATAATCRSLQRYRLAVAAASSMEAAEQMELYLAGKQTRRLVTGSASAPVVPLTFVYSGNGPQWWGMGRELLAENDLFRAVIEAVDRIFSPLAGWSLLAEMQRPQSESRVSLTEYAQPLLFALQLGLTRVLSSSGIVPSAVVGHSVGEVAAAYASGALTLEDAVSVIYYRSKAQAKTAGSGKMAALGVSAADAQDVIDSVGGWLEIAAENAPESVTVAGDPDSLNRVIEVLTERGKFARLLPLNYPFHTKAMEPIQEELLTGLEQIKPVTSSIPFVSTVSGVTVDGEELNAGYWYSNVRDRVEFGKAIGVLLEEYPAGVFLEIGPHPVLKDYVQQIAKPRGLQVASLQTLRRPSLKSTEPETENLWSAITSCYANGAVDLGRIFRRPVPAPDLPLYPWQRAPHWRGGVILPDVHHPTHRDHPLLGYQLTTGEGIWENTVDTNLIGYLKDHVIQRSAIFPAAGYAEMAFAAAERILGPGSLIIDDLDIQRPLSIPDHGDPLIQISVDAATGTFEVRSRPDRYSKDWMRHIKGRVGRNDFSPGDARLNLAELSSRMREEVTGEEHYAGCAARGMDYGPGFQGIEKIFMTPVDARQREALAVIHLPVLGSGEFAAYRAHPSLLDSCFQALISLIGQKGSRSSAVIPVYFRQLRSYAPLTESIVCRIVLRSESKRSVTADFTITDSEGRLLFDITEARCQKVDFGAAGATPLIGEWWCLDSASRGPSVLPSVPTPESVGETVSQTLSVIAERNLRSQYYSEVRPRLDLLARAYIARAIDELLDGNNFFEERDLFGDSIDNQEIVRATGKLLNLAAEYGLVSQDGERWTRSTEILPSPAPLWSSLFEEHPRYQAELMQMLQVGEWLAGLADSSTSADNLPAGADSLLSTAPFQLVYNEIASEVIRSLVKLWPGHRPIRVLEIGGGAGSVTASLLPVLPELRSDYLFTDSSETAIGRAEHRFADFRAIRFMTLNYEADLLDQGLSQGYFDLVVAGNSLHLAGNPGMLLTKLRGAMAPGGLLLAIESHRSPATDLLFFTSSKSSTDDDDNMPSPLKESSTWLKTLSLAGFEGTSVLSDASACAGSEISQQSVFLAQMSGDVAESVVPRHNPGKLTGRQILLAVESSVDAEEERFQRELIHALEKSGSGVHICRVPHDSFASIWDKQKQLDSVVYLAGASTPELTGSEPVTVDERCMAVLNIVQTLESSRMDHPANLTIVTRGGFANAFGEGPVDPAQAPLWGLGRVIANEHPGFSMHLIDLHQGSLDAEEAASDLARELTSTDEETEVQLSSGFRFVNRERLMTLTDEARSNSPRPLQKGVAYRLDFTPQGGLDSLYLRSMERVDPGVGKVEIAVHAAGLNFRDVLWTMGMLPEEAVEEGFSGPTIGMECAGEVVRLGPGVTDFKVGDRVVAFASSCFASHVVTDVASTSRIPQEMEFAEAATIPTAFLTAYYALDHLADLQPGESILIHGAAGGVGLAAIQIAKLNGAKVFGTAGSNKKRKMLETLGVDHVLNSRSLEFADEIMRLTDGVGVDVVLNSLAGEAINRSLKCLRPFGRFLEIGKRDLYANTHLGLRPFRRNLSYFAIDADTLLMERSELARSLFETVMGYFASGALKPLPFETIPISRASEAFRAMQQSRHVGKLVISTELDRRETLPVVLEKPVVKPGATYLVTGGLGGFGLATAKWLAEQGATSIALIGRRGAVTEEASQGIAEIEASGAQVKTFAADISSFNSLSSVLAIIRETMPPLAGIIHSAAVIEDAPIMQISSELLLRVLKPKMVGAWNLHRATLNDPIDMFVMYSSSSTVVGNPGQGAYVAANLYLDSLAQYRRSLGLPGLAIGWGAIKDVGFLTRHGNVAEMLRTRTGMDATPSDEALRDLGRLASAGVTRMCVARFDLQRLGRILPGTLVPRFFPIVTPAAVSALNADETLASRLQQAPDGERRNIIVENIRGHAAKVLGSGSAQIDLDQPLADLGLDSLMAVELAVAIERDLEKPVSVMQLLGAGNINAIADLALKMARAERSNSNIVTVETEGTSVLVEQR